MSELKESKREVEDEALQLRCRIYGHCPVQADGTVAGHRLYFWAKHDEWRFSVSESEAVNPVDIQLPGQGFLIEAAYGRRHGFDAGYMPYDEAEAIIKRCAGEFLACAEKARRAIDERGVEGE